jgi:endoglucanase
VSTADLTPVLQGVLAAATTNADTGEQLAEADFSALAAPGEYWIEVPGVGASAPFRVANDVYREPFLLVTRGMYLWRCGTAVSGEHDGETFAHPACHAADAWLDHATGEHAQRPSVGGWHDAGDYNKYVANAGVTVGCMLRAWEDFQPQIEPIELGLPEAGGPVPEFLAEVKWELDWLLTMQADDGSVYHKVSTADYGGMIPPDAELVPRYFGPWNTTATASFVAMTAQASRHVRPYDAAYADRLLAAARKSYDFLATHPELHRASQEGFTTGGYESGDADDRLWAAAELWEATGETNFLVDLEARLTAAGRGRSPRRDETTAQFDVDFDWGNVKNLALLTYLSSRRDGRSPELVDRLRDSLRAAADEIVAAAAAHGYARPLGSRYYWGCHGSVARQALVLEAAARMTGDAAYRAVQLDALNHLLGRNVYGRSFVTGLGALPPRQPHDRRSIGDAVEAPWPGYLVGGPHPRAASWQDDAEDFRTNEIAINWNAALIYALAAQLN